jgi:iron complex transport system ATP-binding protein
MVELHDVGFRVGDARILDDVSVRFRPDRFNVVLGPNGAGKSTLLRIASGRLAPTAGAVLYDGADVSDIAAEELARRRAVLSQHVELAFPLAVRDVVLMGRYPHYGRAPASRDLAIVDETLALVGLSHKREQAYPTLSGGEQQKAQLARVLAQIWPDETDPGPRCLFLDEPTSSLDVHYQLHLLEIVRGFLARRCTVIAILHDLNVAAQYGDAFFVIAGGRLAFEADSADAIPVPLVEKVFQVRARRETARDDAPGYWHFSL